MLEPAQIQFAREMMIAAVKSGHIFPDYAAAEACLESGWGESKLCQRTKNVFGLKEPSDWQGALISMPTQEYLNGKWEEVPAKWPVFDTYSQAFEERMRILETRAAYSEALKAASGEEFIDLVSQNWSTDPLRAHKVLETYKCHPDLFHAVGSSAFCASADAPSAPSPDL